MSTEHPDSSNIDMCEHECLAKSPAEALGEVIHSCAHRHSQSWCGRRVCRVARMRCHLPSPCVHAPTHVSEWCGPRAGALAHKYQDRTW